MMLAIDGTVYKYDLATKEMLFSFKTVTHTFNLIIDSKHSKE
jgi:hypothetical protein